MGETIYYLVQDFFHQQYVSLPEGLSFDISLIIFVDGLKRWNPSNQIVIMVQMHLPLIIIGSFIFWSQIFLAGAWKEVNWNWD